jgi:hypothetical protein
MQHHQIAIRIWKPDVQNFAYVDRKQVSLSPSARKAARAVATGCRDPSAKSRLALQLHLRKVLQELAEPLHNFSLVRRHNYGSDPSVHMRLWSSEEDKQSLDPRKGDIG